MSADVIFPPLCLAGTAQQVSKLWTEQWIFPPISLTPRIFIVQLPVQEAGTDFFPGLHFTALENQLCRAVRSVRQPALTLLQSLPFTELIIW